MNEVIVLPKVVAGRLQVREIVAARDVDQDVIVDCAGTRSASPSSIDELIRAVLVEHPDSTLAVRDGSPRLVELFERLAANYPGVPRRLTLLTSGGQPAIPAR